ncbi:Sas10/Utp3/C1D family-domain-containing protein [Lasiosphaeris hirsuta]|uniref:Exosome complex protein n=1 Tax=Lasiosphaeris hirsuta TaxID=260670 RepID=A0AA40B8R9_9PEZI|nr:Sas10/Utp3/C1D family-domain-containing protein [Lasiosphaeris hirsuta]
MDVTNITPRLEQLDVDLDQLEEALKPILGGIGDVSSKLPLLDKAKLYVLVSYAIESLLFSSLRLNGVEAKNHAIFAELTRVKQYFDKIQKIETPVAERENSLNTEAAIRFVRSNLGDEKEIKEKLTEQIAKERAKAAIKAAAEKKRAAEQSSVAGGRADQAQGPLAKRPKHSRSRGFRGKMPRQRSGARPTAPARRPAPAQQQTRPATTYAPATQAPHAPAPAAGAPTSQGPGLFGQMATTAAGVAVGSAIGHTLSNAVGGFFGGGSSAPEAAAAAPVATQDANSSSSSTWGNNNCAGATQSFTKCLDDNGGNMQICGWYLEQLKACQAAASPY